MYLVTGGAGFIGSNLVTALANQHQKLRVIDIADRPNWMPKSIDYVQGSITDESDVRKACKGVDTIFHLASKLVDSKTSRKTFWETNVGGTKQLLDRAEECKVKRFVHMSTDMVYGKLPQIPCPESATTNPLGEYGKSKLAAEKVCEEHSKKLKIATLRPCVVVGPGRGGLFSLMFNWIVQNKKIPWVGSGKNQMQMIDVSDLVMACLSVAGKEGIFNVGSDNVPALREQIEWLVEQSHFRSGVVPLPARSAKLAIGFFSKLDLIPIDTEQFEFLDSDRILDTRKLKKEGWLPKFDNKTMMLNAFKWFLAHKNEYNGQAGGVLKFMKWFF